MKTIKVDSFNVLVESKSDSPEELKKIAEAKIEKHSRAGLKGKFLLDSLDSVYPMEYWLDVQG